MPIMTSTELVNKVKNIASNYKTLYVYGCFGAPINNSNKKRYTSNYAYNKRADRTAKINAASSDTFGFDCVNLIKGILWGWNGNVNATYGGADYNKSKISGQCPDTSANGMFQDYCYNKSNNFSNVEPGEFVWMNGHIGVAITNKLAVECTPIWKDGVQITAMNCDVPGYNRRNWTKHGKCKLIDYVNSSPEQIQSDFLPSRGYFTIGDSGINIMRLDNFYASKVLGNYFGIYTKYIVMGAQVKYKISGGADGNVGPRTITRFKDLGLDKSVRLPSRGYFTIGDSGDDIVKLNEFLASLVYGETYGIITSYATKALQTLGKNEGVYDDVIDGNFGAKSFATATHYGFNKDADIQYRSDFQVGDIVAISAQGNSSSFGDKRPAYGIGLRGRISRIYSGRPYPYQVDDADGAIGFYKADAIKKVH